ERDLEDLVAMAQRIGTAMESVIDGKADAIRLALTVLLAEGHLLIEDVPGVGKTMLAKALARSIDCTVRRIQFTPDLLPSDVTGVSVFNQEGREFEFKPGAVFANLVVGDEINRASPKTQSALLEAMEERQVTVYVVALATATREAPELRLGASPRATLQLLRAARAQAALDGRDYVLPDDVQTLAGPVLAHRLLPTAEAQVARRTTEAVVADLVSR